MAVRFSGSGQDYTRTISLGAQTQVSVACWVKLSSDRNAASTFWSLNDGLFSSDTMLQTAADGTTLGLVQYNPTGGSKASRALTVGTWYYVAISINGVNGIMLSRALTDAAFTVSTWTNSVTTTMNNLRIGTSQYSEWGDGAVAAFRWWQAALTQGELENEAWTYRPSRTSGLAAWYPFLAAGTVDYSGAGATLSGGTGTATEDGPGLRWGMRRIPTLAAPLINVSPADTGTSSESLTVAGGVPLAQAASAADTVSVTATAAGPDAGSAAQSLAVTASITLADTASAAEAVSTGAQKALADAATAADTLAANATTPLTQTGTATDALTSTATLGLTETASAADTLAASLVSLKTLTDDAAASDTLTAAILRNIGPAYPPRRTWSAGQPTRYPAG